ncbi:translocation/assembly module TamB domain-containing protein [Flavobacterium soyangense]|uniref:Translocation/assembly module TamB n=1 Tax=Flavobacterium soyangense TaxID=2023265 RepID=A0A930Y0G2_9FLAO|nr:translocation/assembly module TamB domain-containing protein [Flavobacterium soyangense]MBF2708439.1 translocation/assembly module TamB [Flavobacterium soyangense]
MLGIALTLPFVQTRVAQYFVKSINKDFGIHIAIDEASVSVFGGVKLKNVIILDHHKDTLIYANRIKTNILDGSKLLDGDLIFGDITLNGLYFNMKTYKNEKYSNLDKFVASFKNNKPPSKKHFLLTAANAKITNGHYTLIDENRIGSKDVDFNKINASVSNLKVYGPEVNTLINKMSFQDHRGIFVKSLSGIFSYTKKHIKLDKLDLVTRESKLKGAIALNYDIDKGDFSHFTDKVEFDIKLNKTSLASNDIRCFYNELGKNQHFYVNGRIKGPLNNLKITNLKLVDSKKSQIIGTINFKNLFPNKEQEFYMDGKFAGLYTNYDDLVTILPNVLGKRLPVILKKLGIINLVGNTQVTTTSVAASFVMATQLGKIKSDLNIESINLTDKAAYEGNVVLESFDLGTLLDRKDVGKVSLNLDVDGKGFSEKYLNTSVKGAVAQIYYNNYTYNNVVLNGNFKSGLYMGQVSVNDPNLTMNFDGLVDLSKKESRYDFHINVENADLQKLKFLKDSISVFKGDVLVKLSGNTIDNLKGDVFINKTTYQNAKATYLFDDFYINSSFDQDLVRTITINSPDIVQGEIVGKYQFNQLKNLIKNSLGSLYTNYKPEKVKKGQFLKFNFTIYNKIIEIFYPEISIAANTIVKGNINSDKQEFKLNFNSPKIMASANTFDNIRIKIDNKNPLYNAYIELDTIKTKFYKIRDFSLINVTMKDTLFFRSEFKGGTKGEDYFNLNLYHTINAANNNVVGISKSEVKLKDYLWYLNEKETPDNQIVFDKSFHNFNFNNLLMSHENQEISFMGDIKGTTYKDLKLSLKNVDINQITPANPKFFFNGNMNATVNYKQNNDIYQIPASIQIDHLNINKTDLGNLNFDIVGDEKLKKFTLNANIENENAESFKANGNFEIKDDKTILDLDLKFDKFNLGILSSLGGEVLSNIRGFASGNASIAGNLKKPEINGRLYVDDAGLAIPYLNVDYSLSNRTIVDLTDEKFLFKNDVLTDTKFGTKGTLNGSISHNNFSDWKLDLAINSKRLLVLDTKDSEDAAYYGIAFIDGSATIKGPTDGLFIKVDAKSEKGSSLKIPINDSENISENNFIHFLNAKEKFNIKKGIVDNSKIYKGLELEFDLDITPNAEVEVILDRNSGHGMKGKGNGTLLFKINTLGKFNMWGDFQAYEGTYNFKYGGIIDKKFTVKKGGYVSWEGNPMKARLNLEAIYKTSANPALLLENSSFNKKVPVNVIIGLRGDLTSPEPDFNFEFPTVSNVLKSEIEYKLNDKDVRQTQALYLLSTGSFLSAEGVNNSALTSNAFETATSLLSSLIHSEDEKFQVGIDIIGADKTSGKESDGRFVATVSSKINERITINGKVGVPFGGINETAVVGDVEILYRVNEDGTVNLRFFNRENDISYIGEGIGYTQGAGISYEVDFDTFKELANKIFKNKKIEKIQNFNTIDQDSNLPPENRNSSKSNSKELKQNQEGKIPEED